MKDKLDFNEINFNTDPSIIYVDPTNSEILACNLLAFGHEIFRGAIRIKEFEYFKQLKVPYDGSKEQETWVQKFILENLVDNFRIVTAFENYMKAILLLSNCVVHKLRSDNKYKILFEKQKKEPIAVNEVRDIEDFKMKDSGLVRAVLPGITTKTISMSTMLSKPYQDVIQLPTSIYNTINEYNIYRHNHHLYIKEDFKLSNSTIETTAELIKFMTDIVYKLYKDLEIKLAKHHISMDPNFVSSIQVYEPQLKPIPNP